jgi:hypothetical protein
MAVSALCADSYRGGHRRVCPGVDHEVEQRLSDPVLVTDEHDGRSLVELDVVDTETTEPVTQGR